jgi:hypothetical protein
MLIHGQSLLQDSLILSSIKQGPSRSWSYDSWIYNYLCNQRLSPHKLWVRTPFMARCTHTTLCDKVCQWLVTGQWFSPGTLVSSTNKTDRHDITEILSKMALNTINLKPNLKQYKEPNYYITLTCYGCRQVYI